MRGDRIPPPEPGGLARPRCDAARVRPTDEPTPTGGDEPTPAASDEPTPTDEPVATDEPTPTDEPTATPSGSPETTTSPAAAACTGNDDNRAFYAGVASDVAWDVYCPVLPARWFVETGSFRLSGGGRLVISYKGPGGQRIAIREGHYCDEEAGCVPAGTDTGPASFGDRPARLVDAGSGTWIVVAEGEGGLAWEARGTGMDGPTLAGYTAAFAKVGE